MQATNWLWISQNIENQGLLNAPDVKQQIAQIMLIRGVGFTPDGVRFVALIGLFLYLTKMNP